MSRQTNTYFSATNICQNIEEMAEKVVQHSSSKKSAGSTSGSDDEGGWELESIGGGEQPLSKGGQAGRQNWRSRDGKHTDQEGAKGSVWFSPFHFYFLTFIYD